MDRPAEDYGTDLVVTTFDEQGYEENGVIRIQLKASDGFRQAQIDYWIDGKPRAERKPRWNLLDLWLGTQR